MYIVSDQYTDEKFVERIEVEVSCDEVDMIEKEFRRPYWTWELPHATRSGVTVSTYILSLHKTTAHCNTKHWQCTGV